MSSVQRLDNDGVIPNELTKIKLDGLCVFHENDRDETVLTWTSRQEFEVHTNRAFIDREDRQDYLDVIIRLFIDYESWELSNYDHEHTIMYIADPQIKDGDYYVKGDNNSERIDLGTTAGEILQRSRELHPSAKKPLVLLKVYLHQLSD